MKKKLLALLLSAAVTASLTGCSSVQKQDDNYVIDIGTIGIPETTEPPTEPAFQPADVSFVAVGDNLIHSCVYKTAYQHSAEGVVYDFHYCYKNIEKRISAADLAFINQETLICNGELELSGSNLNFNSPVELGYDLVDVGFDIFGMANNHVLDKGEEGIELTLDYWDTVQSKYDNVTVLGTYRNREDMQNYRIIEKNDLKIGMLAYTEHTNGYWLSEDSKLVIPYTDDEALMQSQIQELAGMTDCVVVSMHWGEEDTHEVLDSVKELAQKLVNWGADVIIGTGPHTLQTMEYLTRPDGTRGFVFYSLGNFISGQTDNFNMVGGMGEFHICRDTEGVITIENAGLTPVITQYDSDMTNVRNYPYDLYTDELIEEHFIPYSPSGTAKIWNWEVIDTIVEENVPEEFRRNFTPHSETDDDEENENNNNDDNDDDDEDYDDD